MQLLENFSVQIKQENLHQQHIADLFAIALVRQYVPRSCVYRLFALQLVHLSVHHVQLVAHLLLVTHLVRLVCLVLLVIRVTHVSHAYHIHHHVYHLTYHPVCLICQAVHHVKWLDMQISILYFLKYEMNIIHFY